MKIQGVAWDYDLPVVKYGTTIMIKRGAFKESIRANGASPVRLLWAHNEEMIPVGVITKLADDERGLIFEAEILDTPMGAALVKAMEKRAVRAPSVSFSREEAEYKVDEKTDTITFSRVPLREISAVNFPAHPAASMWLVKEEPVPQPSPPAAGEQEE